MNARSFFVLALIVVPIVSVAHHAVGGNYDAQTIIEVDGEVTSVLWRNPHVQVSMRSVDENGVVLDWAMATTALSNMRRWQIDPSFIEVGDTIRVAGNPAYRIENGLYIRHVLTQEGEEVLLDANVGPRWTNQTIEMTESRRLGLGDTSSPELSIFRVWSSPDGFPTLIPRNMGETAAGRANLTAAALQVVDAFVWARDNPLINCEPKGMPLIMHAPYPFQFVRDGGDIIWHNEEYDTMRRIHMDPGASPEGQPDSLLGYSVGEWENDRTLVVTTTNMGWGHLDGQGIPASSQAVAVERFSLTLDGDRIDYTMDYSDPEYVIEPLTFTKHWVWYPDAVVGEYDCLIAAED